MQTNKLTKRVRPQEQSPGWQQRFPAVVNVLFPTDLLSPSHSIDYFSGVTIEPHTATIVCSLPVSCLCPYDVLGVKY